MNVLALNIPTFNNIKYLINFVMNKENQMPPNTQDVYLDRAYSYKTFPFT